MRDDNMASWAADAKLKLSEPRSFDPPDASSPGLVVNIWVAEKLALPEEANA